jgi:hypothetical protein
MFCNKEYEVMYKYENTQYDIPCIFPLNYDVWDNILGNLPDAKKFSFYEKGL